MNTQLNHNEQHESLHSTADRFHSNSIMEKIYNSDVFKEFIKQWGDTSMHIEFKELGENKS
jgi:hypothetical protein